LVEWPKSNNLPKFTHISDESRSYKDAAQMAEMEGLYGHAAAARCRLAIPTPVSPNVLAQKEPLRLALPKGRMMEQVLKLFKDAGIAVQLDGRVLRATIANFPNIDIKLLNPRNVVEMVGNGARDVGFVGSASRLSPHIFVTILSRAF